MQPLKERLVARRNALGWTQETLAEKSRVSPRSIASYETGESSPTSSKLDLLAKALGVSRIWLMGGDEPREMRELHGSGVTNQQNVYGMLQSETLARNMADLSIRLARSPAHERKHIIGNIRVILDELEDRELTGKQVASSSPDDEERSISTRAKMTVARVFERVAGQDQPGGSTPSPKAASPGDNAGELPERKPRDQQRRRKIPPGPAPK